MFTCLILCEEIVICDPQRIGEDIEVLHHTFLLRGSDYGPLRRVHRYVPCDDQIHRFLLDTIQCHENFHLIGSLAVKFFHGLSSLKDDNGRCVIFLTTGSHSNGIKFRLLGRIIVSQRVEVKSRNQHRSSEYRLPTQVGREIRLT